MTIRRSIAATLAGLGLTLCAVTTAPAASATTAPAVSQPAVSPRALSAADHDGSAYLPAGGDDYTVEEYVDAVLTDLDRTWSAWFHANGFAEPEVGIVTIAAGQTYVSTCSDSVLTSDTPNAFYCSSDVVTADGHTYDGAILVPMESFRRMWDGDIFGTQSSVPGDFAAATVLAHEFGHHVVDEMAGQRDVALPSGKNGELLADCMAGAWMNWADERGLLVDTDLGEAVATVLTAGDAPGEASHGSAAERVAAMTVGFAGGRPTSCVAGYWR